MLLAIDIGNTNITMGFFAGQALRATWRIATEPRRLADEYGLHLTGLLPMKGIDPKAVKKVALCSVVPPLTPVFEELCHTVFSAEILIVGAGVKTGVGILYDSPRDVGTDRIVDAAAAYQLYGGPVIIVDFGTATVFDAVSERGEYLGGAIAPGLSIAAESLYVSTSQLRRVELICPRTAIGKNTTHAMQSGLVFGYVGLVEGMVRRFKEELGELTHVVATGGQAHLIAQATPILNDVNPDLTLHGLRLIYELNQGSHAEKTEATYSATRKDTNQEG